MAVENNKAAEFWLPSEFLPDDFFSFDEKTEKKTLTRLDEEEENEEEEARQHHFLLDQINNNNNNNRRQMVWSRNTKPASAWDLMMLRMGLEEDETNFSFSGRRGLLAPPTPTPTPTPTSTNPFYSLTHHQQLQIDQFNHLKQQQMLKQQRQRCVWNRPVGLAPSSAWPPLSSQPHHHNHHHHPNNGMRAVFLGGRKQPCGGTGVFLPRRLGTATGNANAISATNNPNDYRKKHSGCSTVLLPARVVQALNLNLEEMGANPPRFPNAGFVLDHDVIARNNVLLSQKRSLRPNPQFSGDFRLPPEWTY